MKNGEMMAKGHALIIIHKAQATLAVLKLLRRKNLSADGREHDSRRIFLPLRLLATG
jgi:hypothetical protein